MFGAGFGLSQGMFRPLEYLRIESTEQGWVRSQDSPCRICGAQGSIGTDFSPRTAVFPCHSHSINAPYQGCTNPGRQVAVENKFCMVAPNICGSTVRNFLITIIERRILRWHLRCWEICAPMLHTHSSFTYNQRNTVLAADTVAK
jgi:hypothetical protein